MKYLLDVNAVLAALLPAHADRTRFVAWARRHRPTDFVSCALTELGFVRVAVAAYGYSVADARAMLVRHKRDVRNEEHCGRLRQHRYRDRRRSLLGDYRIFE